MWDKHNIKTIIVLVALLGGIVGMCSISNPWWYGFILIAALFFIGIPIAAILTWWIEK